MPLRRQGLNSCLAGNVAKARGDPKTQETRQQRPEGFLTKWRKREVDMTSVAKEAYESNRGNAENAQR
jgi:hypothetical protein